MEEIKTNEPILIVKLALVIMLISWVVAPIVALINYFSVYNLDGYLMHILAWPMLLVGMLTIGGTPTKTQ